MREISLSQSLRSDYLINKWFKAINQEHADIVVLSGALGLNVVVMFIYFTGLRLLDI